MALGVQTVDVVRVCGSTETRVVVGSLDVSRQVVGLPVRSRRRRQVEVKRGEGTPTGSDGLRMTSMTMYSLSPASLISTPAISKGEGAAIGAPLLSVAL